ncbi:MAG: TlyA family rRNA (cytidine-2'-O)-methyltransferase [Phycisphaerales bacterium]|nr:TlyA family rRNA (cytidine-2'-O)-methyltransferase [Phycisphaerales bacterium]
MHVWVIRKPALVCARIFRARGPGVSLDPEHGYVSRGGVKLRHALDEFEVDVRGLRCADMGCSTGGFTDCLLQAGAAHVTSIDTGYGVLAWKLRKDARVTVMERTNALHAAPPAGELEKMDLVVLDTGWTPQRLCLPAAMKWVRAGDRGDQGGRIITLIKPHYELEPAEKYLLVGGVLDESEAGRVSQRALETMPAIGLRVIAVTKSPITGSKGAARGNAEWLAMLETPKGQVAK